MRALVENVRLWFDDRLPVSEAQEFATHKTVPTHRYSVFYYLGGMTMCFFVIQVVTGILLITISASIMTIVYYQLGI